VAGNVYRLFSLDLLFFPRCHLGFFEAQMTFLYAFLGCLAAMGVVGGFLLWVSSGPAGNPPHEMDRS
jgi:hypothetical protein